jgi:hypothetical protein
VPEGALEPLAAPELGAVLVDPLAALELGELLGAVLADPLALVEPPDAESFLVASEDADELDEDGGVPGVTVAEPEAEPEGALGVVEPAEEDEEPDGGVVRETARSPSLSQPVSNPAPSARDTATAKVESLMCGPPWLG